MGDFTYNGVSARSLGLTVERCPGIHKPRKRITRHSIPGRNGELTQWDGSYDNVTIRYQCWFAADALAPMGHRTLADRARDIADWLGLAPAQARLEDTYDEGIFRLATFVGPLDVENSLNQYGRVDIEFSCAPQSFLASGERRQEVNALDALLVNNPTQYAALPLIEVTMKEKGSGVVRIDDYSLNFFFGYTPADTVYFDCELMEAWYYQDGVAVSCNQNVSSPNYPKIDPGFHRVSWSGLGIASVAIIPRWWRL